MSIRNILVALVLVAVLLVGATWALAREDLPTETPTQTLTGSGGFIPLLALTNSTTFLCATPWSITGASVCDGVSSGIYFPSDATLTALSIVMTEGSPSGGTVSVRVNGESTFSVSVPAASPPVVVLGNYPVKALDRVEIAIASVTGDYLQVNLSLEYR